MSAQLEATYEAVCLEIARTRSLPIGLGLADVVMSSALQGALLVVSARSHPEMERIIESWVSAGGEILRLDQFWAPPSIDLPKVKLYGSSPFCLELSWRLNLSLVSPPDDLLLHLEPRWVGRRIWRVTLGDAADLKYPLFLKSIQPKLLRSCIYNSSEDLMFEGCGLPPETELMAADVTTFLAECRLFVLRDAIVAHSLYTGKVIDPEGMLSFASGFICHADLPETCVVDIGRTVEGEWVIVEVNPVWGAGLRGCHPDPVACCIAAATRYTT